MELSRQLETGDGGLRWRPPEAAELTTDGPAQAIWRARPGAVLQVVRSPFPFSLGAAGGAGAELDPVLRADLEAAARAAFVAHHGERPAEDRPPPRTDDPTWSPVIEAAPVALAGGPAVRLIRRVAYAPGDELVAGHLIVPVADGHLDVMIMARAAMTGMREAVVMLKDSPAPDDPPPTQARYDDPALDAAFPDHPLTIVRARLDALTGGGGLEVTRPAPRPPREVILKEAGCAIAPPPRFVRVAAGLTRMAPTLCMLVRPAVDGWLRTFEVWRVDQRLTGGDVHGRLAALAAATVAAWEAEGVRSIRATSRPVDDLEGRPQIEQAVDFVTAGGPSRSCFRWFVDRDGVVFRVGAGGDGDIAGEALRADLAATLPSWRRLDPVDPGPPPPPTGARRWWKRG